MPCVCPLLLGLRLQGGSGLLHALQGKARLRRLPHEHSSQGGLLTVEVQGILRKPVHCHRNTNIGELRSQVAKATGLGPEHTRLMGAGELTCLAIYCQYTSITLQLS